MNVKETGKICGSLLKAIDEFCENRSYDFDFEQTKCPCANGAKGTAKYKACNGYGNAEAKEYPGIHRSLIFALRGLLFYFEKTKYIYSLNKIKSGYRCWADNDRKRRTSTNHMGCAFDLHFNKNGIRTRDVTDIESIRDNIIISKINAQIRWKDEDKFSLEPSKLLPGKKELVAETWIHLDIRQFSAIYKCNDFFIKKI